MSKLKQIIVFFLIVFNLYFPKGGIKIGDVPITIGMLLIIILGGWMFINSFATNRLMLIDKDRINIVFAWIPFQLIIIISIVFNEISSLPDVLSMIFNFIFLPYCMVFIGSYYFNKVDREFLYKLIKIGIIFVSIYGIIAFFYKFITGDLINIPYLTINADDTENAEYKNIDRGGFFKLVSTYQNGNIYGISMLMLLPIFCYLEKNTFIKLLVKFSLILTLSRTIWFGLIVYEFINAFIINFSVKKIIYCILSIISTIFIIVYMLNIIELNVDFLLDTSMGGRINYFYKYDMNFISEKPLGSIAEIVYLGIINNFGIVGLLLFFIAVISPIVVFFKNKINNEVNKYALIGYIIYLIISCVDGAILLVPVMIFYWFIVLLITDKINMS